MSAHATQPLALEVLIDSQPPHVDSGHRRVALQLFAGFKRKIGQQDAAGSQDVKSSNVRALRHIERHKTDGNPAPDILADLLVDIIVEQCNATFKSTAVMSFVERCDPKVRLTHSLRRTKARSNAGAGWGGTKSACAKHC